MYGMTLEQMKDVDIRTVDPNDLIDISEIIICRDKPPEERIMDLIKQVKNPYCFKVGKVAVKTSYSDCGFTLEDRLESLMMKA